MVFSSVYIAMDSAEKKSVFYEILPVLLCGLSIPLSIFLWLGNLAFSFIIKGTTDGKMDKNGFEFGGNKVVGVFNSSYYWC